MSEPTRIKFAQALAPLTDPDQVGDEPVITVFGLDAKGTKFTAPLAIFQFTGSESVNMGSQGTRITSVAVNLNVIDTSLVGAERNFKRCLSAVRQRFKVNSISYEPDGMYEDRKVPGDFFSVAANLEIL